MVNVIKSNECRLKTGFLIGVFSLLVILPCNADYAENFERNSWNLGGGGSISFSNPGILDRDSLHRSTVIYAVLRPGLFIMDNLLFEIAPGILYFNSRTDPDTVTRSLRLSLETAVEFYAANFTGMDVGLVPSFGIGVGLFFDPSLKYTISGVDYRGSMNLGGTVSLKADLNYFLNDRVAVHIGISPELNILFALWDSDGSRLSFVFKDQIQGETLVTFGVTYFIPSRKRSFSSR